VFEIKLCPHFKERGLCDLCSTVYKAGFGTQWAERACSDCEQYELVDRMTTQADGRVVCRSCQNHIDLAARRKAQPDLFVEQKGLFS
jgi:hypothetical protein